MDKTIQQQAGVLRCDVRVDFLVGLQEDDTIDVKIGMLIQKHWAKTQRHKHRRFKNK